MTDEHTSTNEFNVNSVATDANGRHYELDSDVYDCITVDEESGTVTIHGHSSVEGQLIEALAMERDRLLGYRGSELHTSPEHFVQSAWNLLVKMGYNEDELIFLDDQSKLHDMYSINTPSDVGVE